MTNSKHDKSLKKKKFVLKLHLCVENVNYSVASEPTLLTVSSACFFSQRDFIDELNVSFGREILSFFFNRPLILLVTGASFCVDMFNLSANSCFYTKHILCSYAEVVLFI